MLFIKCFLVIAVGEYFALICDRKALPGRPHATKKNQCFHLSLTISYHEFSSLILLNLSETSDTRNEDLSIYLLDLLLKWSVGGCALSCLEDPKDMLGNGLYFPRTFTFGVWCSPVSKAGREGSEMAGMTLHIFTSLFPNSAPPLISSSRCDGWDRQIWDGFYVSGSPEPKPALSWVSPQALGMQVPNSAVLTSPWWVCALSWSHRSIAVQR